MQSIASRLVVLGTGGTIAGTAPGPTDHTAYAAAQLGIADLLAQLPGLAADTIDSEQVAQLDSKDMDHATWLCLARRVAYHLARDEVQGIVITHGTDTLEETAYFLHRVLAPVKPVVLTAAMRPATSVQADGPQNMLDAATVARWPGAGGVVAELAGRVIGATDLRKLHPYRLDAFDAGDAGAIAQVAQGGLTVWRPWAAGQGPAPLGLAVLPPDAAAWPWVALLTSHAGADARVLDGLLAQGVDGIVLAATGNGTLPAAWQPALRRALDAGVVLVRSTRCAVGALVGEAADELLRTGPSELLPALAGAGGLTPVQARIELMLALVARRAAGAAT